MAKKPISPLLKGFLQRIATTVANASEDKARGEAIIALAPRLLAFPDEAFTEACLSSVLDDGLAKDLHADLCFQRISRWWEANRPRRPGEIPRVLEGSTLPPDAKQWAAYWLGRLQDGALAGQLRLALSLVRSQSVEAFEWLVRNEPEAGIAARYGGMLTSAARCAIAKRDWSDPRKVELALDACQGFHDDGRRSRLVAGLDHLGTLRGLVARWAPENLHLLDVPPPPPRTIFGDDADPPPAASAAPWQPGAAAGAPSRIFGRPLDQVALAQAYAGLPSPAAQYRAAQLTENRNHGEDGYAAARGQDPDRY